MAVTDTIEALPRFARANPRHFEICMTAARTFVERGFDATSVNDVAAALGMTKAGLYHYISSKEALFVDILNLGMDWLEEEVVKPVRDVADPEERLRQMVRLHAKLTAGNEPWITVLLDEMHAVAPESRKKIEARKRSYLEKLRATLVELKAAGRLNDDIDPTTGAFAVLGMIIWLPRWVRPGGRLTVDQVVEQIATIALQGLLKPATRHTKKSTKATKAPTGGSSRRS
jgi:AcrR family transcriptional regulator